MSNMIDLRLIDFLNQNGLSGEEFIILYLIYKDKHEDNVNEKFNTYIENNKGKFDYKDLLNKLQQNEFIINYNKTGYNLSKIKVADKFIEMLFVDQDIAFAEVIAIYPKRVEIQESKYIKQAVYPTFQDSDRLLYHNFIGGRRDKHIRFLAITEQYIEKNGGRAPYKFENYINNFEGVAMMFEEINSNDIADFDIMK